MMLCDHCGAPAQHARYALNLPDRELASFDFCKECKNDFEEALAKAVDDFKEECCAPVEATRPKNPEARKQKAQKRREQQVKQQKGTPEKGDSGGEHNTQQKVLTREATGEPNPPIVSPPKVPDPVPAPGEPNPASPKPHTSEQEKSNPPNPPRKGDRK